jgi:tyrosine-protein phosphatase SIW14
MSKTSFALVKTTARQADGPVPIARPALVAPTNFGIVVQDKIFRSDFPKLDNFEFLTQTLRLRTILTLVEGPHPPEFERFLATQGIKHITINLPANKTEITMAQEDLGKALSVVLDQANYPLLIHCNQGKHRTGCVVGIFRRVQGSSVETALREYWNYAGVKARLFDEELIKSFPITIIEGHDPKAEYRRSEGEEGESWTKKANLMRIDF